MSLGVEVTHDTLTNAAVEVIAARERLAEVAAIAEQAEETLKALAADKGIASVVTPDGQRVALTHKSRRTFNAARFAELVNAAVFGQITVPKVDKDKYDAAVTLGIVNVDAVADAIGRTSYTEIRVYGGDK